MYASADNKPTVLIVDDTAINLEVLVEILRDDYRTKVATNGPRAIALAASSPCPDLILLDIMMPGLNGYQVCEQLKANPLTRDIPIIFVTAMGEDEDEAKGFAAGAVDYITKPISPFIVKARLKTHLALAAHVREQGRMLVELEARTSELSELNRTLEQRVATGVEKVERLSKLKRFFSPSVVEMLLSGGNDDPLKSRRREVTAVFIDLRGFTSFTETSDPEDVMQVLREYHECMGKLVVAYEGTLERFAGDGIMIFFNDPVVLDNSSWVAVQMAIEMQAQFQSLARGWHNRGFVLSMGIGVAHGHATIGAIGFEGRRDYGVIGIVTNLAARLCDKASGGQILISQRVRAATVDHVSADSIGTLELKGFQRPVPAFSVTGLVAPAAADARQ